MFWGVQIIIRMSLIGATRAGPSRDKLREGKGTTRLREERDKSEEGKEIKGNNNKSEKRCNVITFEVEVAHPTTTLA